jgi:hypothetical protein
MKLWTALGRVRAGVQRLAGEAGGGGVKVKGKPRVEMPGSHAGNEARESGKGWPP